MKIRVHVNGEVQLIEGVVAVDVSEGELRIYSHKKVRIKRWDKIEVQNER